MPAAIAAQTITAPGQAIRSASRIASTARGAVSPGLPIGVATTTRAARAPVLLPLVAKAFGRGEPPRNARLTAQARLDEGRRLRLGQVLHGEPRHLVVVDQDASPR